MRKDGLNPSRNKEVRKVLAAHESLVMEMQDIPVKAVTLHRTSPEEKSGRKHGREEVAPRPTIRSPQEWLRRTKYSTTLEGQTYAVTREGVHEETG